MSLNLKKALFLLCLAGALGFYTPLAAQDSFFCPDTLSPVPEDECGFWEAEGDSFKISYRGCFDLAGRQESGLVIRLDTIRVSTGERQGFRCKVAAKTSSEFTRVAMPSGFEAGFYQLWATVKYGDVDQRNESFFFKGSTGPCDTVNVRDVFVVVKDKNNASGEVSGIYGGEFFLDETETITLNHYQLLGDSTLLNVIDEVKDCSDPNRSIIGRNQKAFGCTESVKLMELRLKRIDRESVLGLSLEADKETVAKGDTLGYTLRLSNTSDRLIARTLTLVDSLPDAVTLDESSISISPAVFDTARPLIQDNTITWQFTRLLPQDSLSITYRVRVDSSQQSLPSLLSNSAFAASSCGRVRAEVDVRTLVANVAVTKRSNKKIVTTGDTLDYQITVFNDSPSVATNVTLVDSLPAFVRSDTTDFGGSIDVSLGDLAAGDSSRVTFSAFVSTSALPGELINKVTVRSDNEDPVRSGDNTAFDTVLVALPDVAITKVSDRDTVAPGDSLSYTIRVSNDDPDVIAKGVVVEDRLPALVRHDTTDFGGNLNFMVGDLAPLQVVALSFTGIVSASAPDSTFLFNEAQVSAENEFSGAQDNNVAFDTLLVVTPPPPDSSDITVTKSSDSDSVSAGDVLNYTITVTNKEDIPATNVVVTDILPSLVRVDTTDFGGIVKWDIGDLGPGASLTLDFAANVSFDAPGGSELLNCVEVSADNEFSLRRGDNSDCDLVRVASCDLALIKAANVDTVSPNQVFQYTLTINKSGSQPAFDVMVVDSLSPFLSALDDWPGTVNGNVLSLHIATLMQDTTITFTAQVAETLPSQRLELVNRASISSGCDLNLFNNTARYSVFYMPPEEKCIVLDQNAFRPASAPLRISFELTTDSRVSMSLFDISGYRVTGLVERNFSSGAHEVVWDGRSENGQEVGSGVYLIVFRTETLDCLQRVLLIR